MSIVIFIIILGVLVLVHEAGHFFVARWLGMRVDTFAIGFPPTIKQWKRGEVTYKLNSLPVGGYVSIHGESFDTEDIEDRDRALVYRPPWQQILVFVAGVVMNILLAWIILIILFSVGATYKVVSTDEVIAGDYEDARVTILSIQPDSPADKAGIETGDEVVELLANNEYIEPVTPEGLGEAVDQFGTVDLTVVSGTDPPRTVSLQSQQIEGLERPVIGVSTAFVASEGTEGIFASIATGTNRTIDLTGQVTVALGTLVRDAFVGEADVSTLTGPVGLVGIVGEASEDGLFTILMLMAVISINLAVLNMLPIPALDGGRILFAIIEWIKGSRLNPTIVGWFNAGGFLLLIALLIFVTVHDVISLF